MSHLQQDHIASFKDELLGQGLISRRLEPYLEANFDGIAAFWSDGNRRLRPVLEYLHALGILDERGHPPSSQTLTRTWQRVKEKRAKRLGASPSSAVPPKPAFSQVLRRDSPSVTTPAVGVKLQDDYAIARAKLAARGKHT